VSIRKQIIPKYLQGIRFSFFFLSSSNAPGGKYQRLQFTVSGIHSSVLRTGNVNIIITIIKVLYLVYFSISTDCQ